MNNTRIVYLIAFIVLFSTLTGCIASSDPIVKRTRQLQQGIIRDDTSFVYALPYPDYVTPLIVQGYFGSFSHKNRAALDFKMKKGTPVLAARDGVVVRMENKNDRGGVNKKYRKFANYVVVQHKDGSRAGYWHLKKDGVLVEIGDSVVTGQVIGLSGRTGYAAIGHLHFLVWQNSGGRWQPLPTRFQTKDGPKYLRPWRKYAVPQGK